MRARVSISNPADGGFWYWLLKFYALGLYVLCALVVASLPTLYLLVAAQTPKPRDLAAYADEAALATQILDARGTLLTELARERRTVVDLSEVPQTLIQAFLAAEDRSFFSHAGIQIRGIIRAALANLRAGRVQQGGSTITQQVAKTMLSPERTIERKLRELVLARRIEARFSKEDILGFYLNHIYLGGQAYGVAAAARHYFDKRLDELDLAEAALLAGLAQAPSRYAPGRRPVLAKRRRDHVLRRMREAGFISSQRYQEASSHPIMLRQKRKEDPLPWIAPHFTEHVRRMLVKRYGRDKVYGAGWRVITTVDLPLNQLARQRTLIAVGALDKRQGWRGPVRRVASGASERELLERMHALYSPEQLHPDRPYLALVRSVSESQVIAAIGQRKVRIPLSLMQWAAPYSRTDSDNNVQIEVPTDTLSSGDLIWVSSPVRWQRRRTWGSPQERVTLMQLDQRPRVEGALYLYDHATGYVLAMVGGLDYDRSSFNRTVQACRQPGSAYKPIYFSLALDGDQYSMGSVLQDRPYEPEPGEEWNPQNVHGTLDGKVSLHYALVKSLNLPAIQLLRGVGAQQAADWARRLGFTTPIHADKALALGASCIHTDELTRAFATFARGGSQRSPRYIRQILDRRGHRVEDHSAITDPLLEEDHRLDRLWATSRDSPRQLIDPKTAFLTTKLLRDSVLRGIAGRCRIVPIPTAGKGGTSSDTMDVWFVGLTSRWAATAWIGDDTYQRPLGTKEASYTSAIPMWANFMKRATAQWPAREIPLERPEGLETATIDATSGGLPVEGQPTVEIYYKPGTFELPEPAPAEAEGAPAPPHIQ